MTPDNDMDRAEWLNGPAMPECEDCGEPTTLVDPWTGVVRCSECEDTRAEAAYEQQQAARLADGGSTPTTPDEQMAHAHAMNRAGR
jgi:ribosomal protein L37AE/L43A